MREVYFFESKIYASKAGKGGAYIILPCDIRRESGAGRVKVQTTFDNVPYEGSIVNMGVKSPDGSVRYILGLRENIRENTSREIGDIVAVTVKQK